MTGGDRALMFAVRTFFADRRTARNILVRSGCGLCSKGFLRKFLDRSGNFPPFSRRDPLLSNMSSYFIHQSLMASHLSRDSMFLQVYSSCLTVAVFLVLLAGLFGVRMPARAKPTGSVRKRRVLPSTASATPASAAPRQPTIAELFGAAHLDHESTIPPPASS